MVLFPILWGLSYDLQQLVNNDYHYMLGKKEQACTNNHPLVMR